MEYVQMEKVAAARAFEVLKLQGAEIEKLKKEAAVSNKLSEEQAVRCARALVHAGKAESYHMDKIAKALAENPGELITFFEKMANEVAAVPGVGRADLTTKSASAVRTADDAWREGFGSI